MDKDDGSMAEQGKDDVEWTERTHCVGAKGEETRKREEMRFFLRSSNFCSDRRYRRHYVLWRIDSLIIALSIIVTSN